MGNEAVKILADNLNRLIGLGKRFASNEAAASASGVSRSTIDRARRGEVNLRVDNIAELAKAFHLQPWELLYPGLDPATPPSSSEKGTEWPLVGVTPQDFDLIPAEEREEVTALVQSKINRHRVKPKKSAGGAGST
jgi:transcriptional regulator with XRE-family HTH domain